MQGGLFMSEQGVNSVIIVTTVKRKQKRKITVSTMDCLI
jgi:hypothetical protein